MPAKETKWREGLRFDIDRTLDNEKYMFEWSAWLSAVGADTLSDASIIAGGGLNVVDKEVLASAVTALFSCATDAAAPAVGAVLKATCVAETSSGQSKARSIYFRVVDKQ